MGDVFLNDTCVGSVDDSHGFVANFSAKRRSGEVGEEANIYHDKDQDYIYIESGPGRVRRPLIVVENGKSKLTADVVKKLKSKQIGYDDSIKTGVREYLDALEENDAYTCCH